MFDLASPTAASEVDSPPAFSFPKPKKDKDFGFVRHFLLDLEKETFEKADYLKQRFREKNGLSISANSTALKNSRKTD